MNYHLNNNHHHCFGCCCSWENISLSGELYNIP